MPASPLCTTVKYRGKASLYTAMSRCSDRRPNLSSVHAPEHGTAPGTPRISPRGLVTTTLPAKVVEHLQVQDQIHLSRPFEEAAHACFASPRLSPRRRIAAHRHLDQSRPRHLPWSESTTAASPQDKTRTQAHSHLPHPQSSSLPLSHSPRDSIQRLRCPPGEMSSPSSPSPCGRP
jgi:hypothetical protein